MDGSINLRDTLRVRCKATHDALDAAMAPWAEGPDFAAFLRVQHAARAPIEAWLSDHAPKGWEPPRQTPLIVADLATLRTPAAAPGPKMTVPADAFWGVAWAIAGSSLGNRAMLQRRRKAGLVHAEQFLSDPAMSDYWKRLVPHLETADAGSESAAVAGAEAVFALFHDQALRQTAELAA